MSAANYNWMYGKALYLEVRDALHAEQGLSNLQIRALLMRKHRFNGTPEQMRDLYERIARTTSQLYQDGYLERTTELAKNRNPKYLYTLKPQPTC